MTRAEAIEELRAQIARLEAERDRCHERLEIDHHFVMVGEDKLERREVPMSERADEIDGIEARDCTIALQDKQIDALQASIEAALSENERLRKALIAAGRHVGAGLADDVSTDFLMLVPEEVRLVMERHRAATPTDRLGGGE